MTMVSALGDTFFPGDDDATSLILGDAVERSNDADFNTRVLVIPLSFVWAGGGCNADNPPTSFLRLTFLCLATV
jgi:hypothetical protein